MTRLRAETRIDEIRVMLRSDVEIVDVFGYVGISYEIMVSYFYNRSVNTLPVFR